MPLAPGQTLGHYRVVAKLGEGGMGEVYEAHDLNLGRSVALKTLTAESATRRSRLDRFRTEAKAVAALNHPNIVHIYSVEEADGINFLTMEKVAGKPLDQVIPDGGMSIRDFLSLASALAGAVSAAHKRGITHRDLKPANILVDQSGTPKILDFGLAKMAQIPEDIDTEDERTVMMTREGAVIGSAPYMSPEQARGEAIDSRTDIFSLGTVLYQALTGISPFQRKSSIESQFAVIQSEPKSLADLRLDLPQALVQLVEKALAKKPADRYSSAEDLLNELQRLEDEVRVASATHTALQGDLPAYIETGEVQPARSKRRTFAIWGLAAAVVVTVLILVWPQLAITGSRTGAPTSLAVLPFDNLTGAPADEYLGRGVAIHLITQLGELADLRVVGRSEAWDTGNERSRQELARRLAVGLFLDGAVQRDGEDLLVTVQLSDTSSNSMVWGEVFRRAEIELMELQSDISRRVTAFLEIPLSRSERRRLTRTPTQSFRAYDFYLQGQDHLANRPLRRGPELAVSAFQQAINLDPEFALAHVGLSEAFWRRYREQRDERFLEEAKNEARLARELDAKSASAQVALARVLREEGDLGRAIAELQQAASSHPKPDEAYVELGNSFHGLGEQIAAEEWFRAAVAFGPDDWWNWNSLGVFLTDVGQYDEATTAFRQAEANVPEDRGAWVSTNLMAMQLMQGEFEEAVAGFDGSPADISEAGLASNLGTAYFYTSDLQNAELLYKRAIELDPEDPIYSGNLGDLYLQLGREDDAKRAYETAVTLAESRASIAEDTAEQLAPFFYQAKAGDCSSALGGASSFSIRRADIGHSVAVIYALCGSEEEALNAVASAIQLGFPAQVISQEPEFSRFRDNRRFRELTS